MTQPLAGLRRDDGGVVVPAAQAGEVLRLLSRALIGEARETGATATPAARALLAALYEAARSRRDPAAFPDETTPAPSSTVELTAEQAAGKMGSSTQWARTLARCGQVRARRVGRTWLIDAADLDRYRYQRGSTAA